MMRNGPGAEESVLRVDGSAGEGGGQILRTSLALSAITGRAVEVVRIRAGRARPGLQPQHLAAVRAAAALCAAEVLGVAPGATELVFRPTRPVQAGEYRLEIGTAGAATLLAQAVLVPLALAPAASSVTVTGGTHVPHAPHAEYLLGTYLPALRLAGLAVAGRCPVPGFLPRGGGRLELSTEPGAVQPLQWRERGRLRHLRAVIRTSALPDHVAERGAAAVSRWMKGIGRTVEVSICRDEGAGPGAAVTLCAVCEQGLAGFSALGERGRPMELVAESACTSFLRWWRSGAAVDEFLADQLVLPLALAAGASEWTAPAATAHLRTVLPLVEQFLPVRGTIHGEGTPVRIALAPAG